MTGVGIDQSGGSRRRGGSSSPAAHLASDLVEVVRVASRSASMIACMSSARPITPSSATLLCAEITSSMPGRRAATSRSPLPGWRAPPGPKIAS